MITLPIFINFRTDFNEVILKDSLRISLRIIEMFFTDVLNDSLTIL